VAQIFAFWRSQLDYEDFQAGAHDRIAESQAGTYDGIEVRLFERHLDIGAGLPADGSVARLAHCHVKAGRQEHFVLAQADVWNPGMVAAPGMRGGVFGRRGDDEFLVLSLWNSAADHEGYRTDRFPELRRRSDAAGDLDGIAGDLVQLDPSWTVRPQVGQS
jgi:heme-degrading monooxygenase HmoA